MFLLRKLSCSVFRNCKYWSSYYWVEKPRNFFCGVCWGVSNEMYPAPLNPSERFCYLIDISPQKGDISFNDQKWSNFDNVPCPFFRASFKFERQPLYESWGQNLSHLKKVAVQKQEEERKKKGRLITAQSPSMFFYFCLWFPFQATRKSHTGLQLLVMLFLLEVSLDTSRKCSCMKN